MILEAFTKSSAGTSSVLQKDLMDTQSKTEEGIAKVLRDGGSLEDDENGPFKGFFHLSNNLFKVIKKDVLREKENRLKSKANSTPVSTATSSTTLSNNNKNNISNNNNNNSGNKNQEIAKQKSAGHTIAAVDSVERNPTGLSRTEPLDWDKLDMSSISSNDKEILWNDTVSPIFSRHVRVNLKPISEMRGRSSNIWRIVNGKVLPNTATFSNCVVCFDAMTYNKSLGATKGVSRRNSCTLNSFYCNQDKCNSEACIYKYGHGNSNENCNKLFLNAEQQHFFGREEAMAVVFMRGLSKSNDKQFPDALKSSDLNKSALLKEKLRIGEIADTNSVKFSENGQVNKVSRVSGNSVSGAGGISNNQKTLNINMMYEKLLKLKTGKVDTMVIEKGPGKSTVAELDFESLTGTSKISNHKEEKYSDRVEELDNDNEGCEESDDDGESSSIA